MSKFISTVSRRIGSSYIAKSQLVWHSNEMLFNTAAAVSLSSSSSSFLNIASPLQQHQIRTFSESSSPKPLTPYYEKKKKDKEYRRQVYDRRMANKLKKQLYQKHRIKGVRKKRFNDWFFKYIEDQDYHIGQALDENLDMRVRVVSVLQREPIVTHDRPQWEVDFDQLTQYLSQYGLTFPPGTDLSPDPVDVIPQEEFYKMTDEDLYHKLLPKGLVPMPRITEDDEAGNVKSMNRKLPLRLYLTTKFVAGTEKDKSSDEKKKGGNVWTFPSTIAKENETMLDAALRVFAETLAPGKELETWSPGTCPMVAAVVPYSESERALPQNAGYYGEKLFYFRIQCDSGDIKCTKAVQDYAWLSRAEMVEKARDEQGDDAAMLLEYLLVE
uniref:Ribosomal protein L46 N-terminal domain-containing protein n=1 Tax=Proboscia inermis TaxID=420281 RepID=A0A7S0C934_9STRA|mmetsp:Transcript_34904/g.35087  ORF Transcript_34904/g.35087 Transcript_34904/m.35087 type:complete len:384 (+) Transcript_34904:143-1294(+)|eukprot:CAMPEP_0171297998 /NCGR_PEP_ID=MMETSP0816-20121228/6759_1 /TAXON_ID=420281 /ORGANISM="Proboscia inermis, Strain CCAP1064/1" /LENGTH=383 /DNA_ID=CAMNT_0011772725 /DNA_START=45 /DNA_END=1196 /DNA_ORIENTATION=-